MKCRRAFEADVVAALHGAAGGDDGDFLAHAEACADCAAEVRVWRELDAMLRTGAVDGTAHPEPEALVAFVDDAKRAPGRRAEIERHLTSCRVCADEVRSLRGLDAAALALPAAASPTPHPTATGGIHIGRVLWHPAFAYALVVVLLVPLLRSQMPRLREETRAVDARREPPAAKAAEPVPPGAATGVVADAAPAAPPRAAPPAQAPGAATVERARQLADAESSRRTNEPGRGAPSAAERKEESHMHDQLLAGEPRAAAPAGASAAAGARTRIVLEVQPQRPSMFAAIPPGRPVLLRIVPPGDLAPGPVAIQVRGRANQRTLDRRVENHADAIAVDIPADWLVPGDYAVTLQPLDDAARAAGAPAMIGFSIAAPTSAR